MGFFKGINTEEREVTSQRVEQLDLLRRLSCMVVPRADQKIVKSALILLGLLADRDVGEELFKLMRRFD